MLWSPGGGFAPCRSRPANHVRSSEGALPLTDPKGRKPSTCAVFCVSILVVRTFREVADERARIFGCCGKATREALYLIKDVIAQRSETCRQLAPVRGEHVLDIGSGSGFLCESIAALVGSEGAVVGIEYRPI
jgi:Protein-L-isoaspartate(D-aspartate) O-methyltransferase (PCMT)